MVDDEMMDLMLMLREYSFLKCFHYLFWKRFSSFDDLFQEIIDVQQGNLPNKNLIE